MGFVHRGQGSSEFNDLLAKVNPRKWLTWYLQSCAEAGGQAPKDITSFLPWNLSEEQRRHLASEPADSS